MPDVLSLELGGGSTCQWDNTTVSDHTVCLHTVSAHIIQCVGGCECPLCLLFIPINGVVTVCRWASVQCKYT